MLKTRRDKIDKHKKLKEWSKLVRQRDNNKCVICQTTKYIHTHHLFPKEAKMYHYLRFDIDNGITLCARHHKYSYQISPHKNPMIFVGWLIHNRNEQIDKLWEKIK